MLKWVVLALMDLVAIEIFTSSMLPRSESIASMMY
jgi:hypothetical protein